MSELYVFSQYEQPLTILSEDTGLVSTHFREEKNSVPTTPFSFTIEADHPESKHVKEENKVVFKDREGDWRMMVIRELDDSDTMDGPVTTATCEPAFLAELNDHIVVDRRFVERTADVSLDAALEGTRWRGSVEVELGNATTNFYYITSVEAIWNILSTWGGEFKDVIEFNEETNEITAFKIKIIQRLGKEHGQRFEIDHNINEIGRTVLSYPKTALYGRGASLPYEDDEGEHTGGYTRYIGFEEVEWKVSNGDPVDKPKGQRWVGSPDALAKYGLEDGTKHRYGIYSNQDYEDPDELLKATWHHLQEVASQVEVNYRLSVELFDDEVSLGDTATAIDRKFSRPIEIQTRIIALEYDLLDPDGTMVVEMGQFLDFNDNRLDELEKEVESIKSRPPSNRVTEDSYPDTKPGTPVNVEVHGGMEVIQLYWDYADDIYIKHYEVYGSCIDGFIPDSQHLLWRGNVSVFSHPVGTNEVWYYRVRAVNYHGTPSDYSVQVSAGTHRVVSEDILWGPDIAERMRELHSISDIIGEGGVDFDQISQEAKNLIDQQARTFTNEQIEATRSDLMGSISNLFNELEYIDGQLVDKVNKGDVYTISDIDSMFRNAVSVTRYETDMDGVVENLEHHNSLIEQNEREIRNRVEQTIFENETGYLRQSISDVRQFAEGIESTVSNIQIGGENLASIEAIGSWSTGATTRDGYKYRLEGLSNGLYIHQDTFKLNTQYIFSFKIEKISGTIDVVSGHQSIAKSGTVKVYKNGEYIGDNWSNSNSGPIYTGSVHEYVITFESISSIETSSDRIYIQPNRNTGYDKSYVAYIWDIQLKEGNTLSGWTVPGEDTNQRMTDAESRITQLADEIDLKVDVDGIVSQINLNREGVRIKGNLIHLDGTTLIKDGVIQNAHIANGTIERAKLVRAIIGEAQIEDLAVTDAKIASLNADKINASSLSAISANLGTVRAGRLLSSNNNLDANLNTGNITLRNAYLTIANGAQINFEDAGNTLTYRKYDSSDGFSRSAGIGVGDRIGGRYPFAYLGTTGASNLDSLSPYFSGFIANSTAATGEDNAANSVNGWIFQMRSTAVNWEKGLNFDFNGSPTIRPYNGHLYNYNLGNHDHMFNDLHIRRLYTIGGFDIFNNSQSGVGWRLTTIEESGRVAFRGLNGGSYNYDLGASESYNHFHFGYIRNLRGPSSGSSSVGHSDNPYAYGHFNSLTVHQNFWNNSLREYKENIKDLDLETAIDFVRNNNVKTFYYKNNSHISIGLIRDDLVGDDSLVANETAISPTNVQYINQKVTQYLLKDNELLHQKLDDEINWQRIEYTDLKNKVIKLEKRIEELEEQIA